MPVAFKPCRTKSSSMTMLVRFIYTRYDDAMCRQVPMFALRGRRGAHRGSDDLRISALVFFALGILVSSRRDNRKLASYEGVHPDPVLASWAGETPALLWAAVPPPT